MSISASDIGIDPILRSRVTALRPNEAGGAVQLYVTNNSGGPMEVYAAGTGTLYRIGTVHPGLEGRFVVRPTMVVNGTVEFVARSGNGPILRSGRILLVPGDVVDFDLTPSPVTSQATVRPRPPATRHNGSQA